VRVEVRALVVHDGRIAVNEERRHGRPRLSLPGGRVERWESVEEALVRELREELGIEVECGEFVCAFQVLKRFHIQDLNIVFKATLKDAGDAAKLRMVDVAENGSEVFPPILERVAELSDANGHDAWLGNMWRDDLRSSV